MAVFILDWACED